MPSSSSTSLHDPTTVAPAVALSLRSVTRVYGGDRRSRAVAHPALRGIDLDVLAGRTTAVMGPSGSGKTTLLHCAAGLDRPTEGTVHLGGIELSSLGERARTELRRQRIGFVFQHYNLVPSLTVEENVDLPHRMSGRRPDRAWRDEILARVGLADHTRHLPSELSGGQQQRAAIARAVVTRPDVIFADEPTGALDRRSGEAVLALLRQVVEHAGQTVVLVTHDPAVAASADRVVMLDDGRIVADLDDPTRDEITEHRTRAETAGQGASS